MKSLQEINESFRIALSAIKANKSRGILTTLGIVIGIMAVVTTMTAANGLGNRFKERADAHSGIWLVPAAFAAYRRRPQRRRRSTQADGEPGPRPGGRRAADRHLPGRHAVAAGAAGGRDGAAGRGGRCGCVRVRSPWSICRRFRQGSNGASSCANLKDPSKRAPDDFMARR